MSTSSLFFYKTLIDEVEAPKRVLEGERFACNYNAVLKKRFGSITANDFLRYARRFSILCNEVYGESNLVLCVNKDIPLGGAFFAATMGFWIGNQGEKVEVGDISDSEFCELFAKSSSLELTISPKIRDEDNQSSFSQMIFTVGRTRTIFYYSQGGKKDCSDRYPQGTFLNLLRKMFFVRGTAPNLRFSVKLGLHAYLREAEGRTR